MEYIVLLAFAYILLKLCGKMLRHFLSPETTAFWLVVIGLCLFGLEWAGLLLIAWRYIVIPIGIYYERHPGRRYNRKSHGNSNINRAVMWLIPVFWPFLIARMFLSGKTYKPGMTEYDYEQFLKGNGK